MITLTHPIAPEEIMAWLDGELSADEQQAVEIHIARCVECAQLEDQFRRFSQQVQRWTVETVPPRIQEKIESRFATTFTATSTKVQKNTAAKRRGWHPALIVALGTAATILVFVFTVPMGKARMKSFSESEQTATVAARQSALNSLSTSSSVDKYERIDRRSQLPDASLGAAVRHPAAPALASVAQVAAYAPAPPSVVAAMIAPMIARTVSLSIVVKNFTLSRAALDALLARHHGYAAELTVTTPESASRSFQASLRVPANELAATLNEVKSLGRVENETQSGEEVTQQHVDLLARLKNSRETEQRFQAILQQRTGKIEDVLEVEQEIARVRGEIETMEADQQNLEHRVNFATVNLQLTEEYQAQLNVGASPSISTQIRNALVSGYRHARDTTLAILLFAAETGPTLLVLLAIFGVPLYFLIRRYRRIQASLN
jgi:hypothetical protein